MTIYAASATDKGRRFYGSTRVTSLSVRRIVILGILQSKGWVEMEKIQQGVTKAATNPDFSEALFEADKVSEILPELFALKKLEYIMLATFKYKNGGYEEHAPTGMTFRY